MLQETKKSTITKSCFKSFWGRSNKEWIYSPSKRSVGLHAYSLESELFKLEAVECGAFSLSAKLSDSRLGTSWWISCIYGRASNIGKEEFWIESNDLGNLTEGAWCIGADFNEVLYQLTEMGEEAPMLK